MDGSKPWYQSKTILSAGAVGLIGIYNAIAPHKGLPAIPEWVYTLLGTAGIYTRFTATDKLTF